MSIPFVSSFANDGILDQTIDLGQLKYCTQTIINEPSFWWTVDLGSVYDIESITIYNRKHCCGKKYVIFMPVCMLVDRKYDEGEIKGNMVNVINERVYNPGKTA